MKNNRMRGSKLVASYGDIDLDQRWLGYWLDDWWHQAITRTIADLSSTEFCGMHPRTISQDVLSFKANWHTDLQASLKYKDRL